MNRIISAHYIWPVNSPAVRLGMLTCTTDGEILNITSPPEGPFRESQSLEFYDGLVLPAFLSLDPNESQQDIFRRIKQSILDDPSLNPIEILRTHTLDRARLLNREEKYGCFKPGSRPGINLISGLNLITFGLNPSSTLRVLIPC